MHLDSLLVIVACAVIAPMLAFRVRPWLMLPSVVVELLLGILVGPQVLDWAQAGHTIRFLAEFGLAMLMFLAGYEIDFARVRGRPLRRALLSWLISLALGLLVGLVLLAGAKGWTVIGMALTTTALGTILPIVRDSGKLGTPFGSNVLAIGSVGEFGPIVAIALILTSDQPLHQVALLLVFVAIALGAAALASRPTPPRLRRLLSATLGSSAQLAVRLSLLVIVGMLAIAHFLELDILLGAFTAGIVVRLAIRSIDQQEIEIVESKMDAIAFGFVIPIYFVVSGMRFELRELITSPAALLAMVLFVPAFLLVRGLPVYLASRRTMARTEARALGLLAATALPLVVAITDTGVANGDISPAAGAALVGAAMISVLFFPVLALRRLTAEPDRWERT